MLITTVITGAAGVFTLVWQSKEHERDVASCIRSLLDPVRLWRVPRTNELPTTVGEFQTRMDADAYVQVVRARWPGARVMRLPKHWELETCFGKAAGQAD